MGKKFSAPLSLVRGNLPDVVTQTDKNTWKQNPEKGALRWL